MWVMTALRPDEHIAVQQALIMIETRLVPADQRAIIAAFTALAEYYNDRRPQDALTTAIDMLVEDLAEFSMSHIEKAIREHRKSNNWFPKSAELIPLCQKHQAAARTYARRARVLLGLEEPRYYDRLPDEPQIPATDIDRELLEARLAKVQPDLADRIRGLVSAANLSDKSETERRFA